MIPSFIYFVNLDDFLVSYNLGYISIISSPTLSHLESFKEEHPVYSVDPDKMLTDMRAIQGFLSPRLSYVSIACAIRNGIRLQVGIENPKFYSDADNAKIIRIAELEIEIEKIRREINPELPSRLVCLFLAEDNFDGRIMLQNMFSDKKSFCIVPVKINYRRRFHKADSKWIDEYEKTKDKIAIENYWKGIFFDKNPRCEYLLDGQIELLKQEDKEYILKDYDARRF